MFFRLNGYRIVFLFPVLFQTTEYPLRFLIILQNGHNAIRCEFLILIQLRHSILEQ